MVLSSRGPWGQHEFPVIALQGSFRIRWQAMIAAQVLDDPVLSPDCAANLDSETEA
jgi:hypothetical protein